MMEGEALGVDRRSLPTPAPAQLSHIPGESGFIGIGHTLAHLKDTGAFARRMTQRYGPVFRQRCWGTTQIGLMGPEANELVLQNKDGIFSSEFGWKPNFEYLFPRGLMMMDFATHRAHRKLMNTVFKPNVMATYVARMNEIIGQTIQDWTKSPSIQVYPALKALTLRLAAAPFLGLELGPEADRVNNAFRDIMKASVAPLRRPYPFSQMQRGVRGRETLIAFLRRELAHRRGSGATDMFSVLANARDADGSGFSDDEVIDHMIFLMMAAHDTLASSGTAFIYQLAKHPDWQGRLREVCASVGNDEQHLGYEVLDGLNEVEMAFFETLRLHPPLSNTPRRALDAFDFAGYAIPKGSYVWISANYTHRMPEIWPDPDNFNPLRFTADAIAERPKYAWIPFGGGAHKCIGLHFASMQIKILAFQLLTKSAFAVPHGYMAPWQPWPLYKPKDGLPMTFRPRQQVSNTAYKIAAE